MKLIAQLVVARRVKIFKPKWHRHWCFFSRIESHQNHAALEWFTNLYSIHSSDVERCSCARCQERLEWSTFSESCRSLNIDANRGNCYWLRFLGELWCLWLRGSPTGICTFLFFCCCWCVSVFALTYSYDMRTFVLRCDNCFFEVSVIHFTFCACRLFASAYTSLQCMTMIW